MSYYYPNINPIAIDLSVIQIHWYGIMYLIGFASAWLLALWRIKKYQLNWSKNMVSDLIFYSAMGVLVGGRLGYMIFYDTFNFIHHPASLFQIRQGGMSFHGGLIGVCLALYFFGKKYNKSFLSICDFASPLVPLGLAAGRIGNFINGELWGRVTDVPWAMIYMHVDENPRHPSQIYEFLLEGILLFVVVWVYARKPRPVGQVAAVFTMTYASCRILAEYFRQPDAQLGFISFGWLTMGQLLCIPMFIIGLTVWCWKEINHEKLS